MAELNFQINVGGNAGEAVGSLKKQLREAQAEVALLSDKFGATSKEATEAAKRAADLKDRIGDAKALVAAFNPDQKFTALSKSLGAVAGGFSAIQGAMGLFGAEGKELEKTMLKVQSALALSQGLEQLGDLGDAFKNLKTVAVSVFNSIKTAIGSTGIGLLVIALGAIYTYWEDIKEVVSGVSEEQKKLNKATQENLKAQQEKLNAIGEQDNILKLQGKSEKDILNLKIKQSDEAIKAAEINLANAKATRDAQVAAAKRNKEILQGLIDFVSLPITTVLRGVDAIGSALGKNLNLTEKFTGGLAKMVFDPEETAKEGDAAIKEAEKTLTSLKNGRAGYQLAVQNIDKEASDKARQNREKDLREIEQSREKELELEKKKRDQVLDIEKQIRSIRQQSEKIGLSEKDKRLLEAKNELDNNLKLYQDNLDARQKAYILYDERIKAANAQTALENTEKEKKDEEDRLKKITDRGVKSLEIAVNTSNAEFQLQKKAAEDEQAILDARLNAQLQFASALGSVFGNLSAMFEKGTTASKVAALAEIGIQSGIGLVQGLDIAQKSAKGTGPAAAFAFPIFYATQVAAVLSAVSKAKGILSTVKGGGGSSAPMPSISTSAPMTPQAPQAQITQLNAASINALGNQAIKAYVVETDVTTNQQRVKAIQQRARFD